MSQKIKAIFLALFVTVLWSTSWVLIKIGLKNSIPSLTFAGLRYFFAFLCMAPVFLFNRRHRTELRNIPMVDWVNLAILGILFILITQGSMFLSLSYLPANTLSLLLNLTSLFVGIFGVFLLREIPTQYQWIGLLLAVIGLGFYFLPLTVKNSELKGLGIGVICLIANIASALLSRNINKSGKQSPLTVTFISIGIGSIPLLILGVVTQGLGNLSVLSWIIILWMALINTALAFTLWNLSLQTLSAVESSILNSLMLPQIAILSIFILGETVSTKSIIGLSLVCVGTIVVQLKKTRGVIPA